MAQIIIIVMYKNTLKINKYFVKICILCITLSSAIYGDVYYKLDDYDMRYKKLDEPPLPPQIDKSLHPSSIHKYKYRKKKNKKPSYSRIEIINNKQALNRIENKQQDSPRNSYFLLGVNAGVDLYSANNTIDTSFDLGLKIGYIHMFSSNSLRTYMQTSGQIGIKNINNSINMSINIDALFDITIANLYVGGGYGGEYYFYNKQIIHGPHINLGINKIINKNSNFDIGIIIPFYENTSGKKIKNNINFVFAYNYIR